jgi:hypothetical protein
VKAGVNKTRCTRDFAVLFDPIRSEPAHPPDPGCEYRITLTQFDQQRVPSWNEQPMAPTRRQGIVVLKALHAQGQHDLCLQLAERLLKINPFLPEVIDTQIQATSEHYGEEASKLLQSEIIQQLKVQFGGIPEDFQAMLRTTTL